MEETTKDQFTCADYMTLRQPEPCSIQCEKCKELFIIPVSEEL